MPNFGQASTAELLNQLPPELIDIGADTSRPFWNMGRETMPFEQMRALQTAKLQRQVAYLGKYSEFYKRKFQSAGFDHNACATIKDISAVPFTTKAELRDSQAAHPPFGLHQAASMDDIVRVTATSGTTGKSVFQGYTAHDTLRRSESLARVLWGFGVRPGDRVINGFALSMFNAGIPLCAAVERLGAVNIPAGAERRVEGMLTLMQQLKATVWVGTPSFAAALAERCTEVLGVAPQELGLRILCGGGESGFEQPAFQKRMEEAWGTPHVFDFASTSDAHPNVFAHCQHRDGKHHLTPDLALIELIDPATGAILEFTDGIEGEYVFTHLDRQACPLFRYRTGDIIKVRTSKCACGRTGFRMDIVGRSDDMLIVRGINVFPSALQSVISTFSPQMSGAIQVVLSKPGPAVIPPLRIRVEAVGANKELKTALEQVIRRALTVSVDIEFVPVGTLGRTEKKSKLIVLEEL
ncbi:MAG TPA: AMP-binding protein [Paralcaligenes sp.]